MGRRNSKISEVDEGRCLQAPRADISACTPSAKVGRGEHAIRRPIRGPLQLTSHLRPPFMVLSSLIARESKCDIIEPPVADVLAVVLHSPQSLRDKSFRGVPPYGRDTSSLCASLKASSPTSPGRLSWTDESAFNVTLSGPISRPSQISQDRLENERAIRVLVAARMGA
jgi:hypothetical protein